MKKQNTSDRSLFAMPQEMRPTVATPREPATAKRIAMSAGLADGSKPVSKQKKKKVVRRDRRLNGLR